MTMYRSVDGKMNDYHLMLMGSRAAGGFGLVFPEQIAITPDGRTGTCCAGIWHDDQIEGLARMCALVKEMGAVPRHPARPYRAQGQRAEALGRQAADRPRTTRMAGRCAGRPPSPMAAATPIRCRS